MQTFRKLPMINPKTNMVGGDHAGIRVRSRPSREFRRSAFTILTPDANSLCHNHAASSTPSRSIVPDA